MITGLRALECGYEEVREELFQTMKSLTEVFDFFTILYKGTNNYPHTVKPVITNTSEGFI